MEIPVWALVPFVLMLLTIAIAPLIAHHWWENNRNKLLVSLILGIPTAIYLIVVGLTHNLYHQMVFDYIPFIVLLGALFVVTGGIHIKGNMTPKLLFSVTKGIHFEGNIVPRPLTNTLFLITGAILASIMGTTGAAMLLIRPLISISGRRKFKVHTILFFIAIVANCGGLLTPLGDPPLFLLYLRGADFTWFFNLLPEWLLVNGLLLAIYFIWDSILYKKEDFANRKSVIVEGMMRNLIKKEPIRIVGGLNFLFLAGVVASVAFLADYKLIQTLCIAFMAVLSLIFTKKTTRSANKFSWTPIIEVAFLFLGIFVTMTPALLFLANNATMFGLVEPWQFYYTTGGLSAFLDNAPTAISFYEVALNSGFENTGDFIAGIPPKIMQAIALGSVLFGAMTYIGNGPNFMVKAIAEENQIPMPSFFGYILKFSLVVLLPVYIVVQLVFL